MIHDLILHSWLLNFFLSDNWYKWSRQLWKRVLFFSRASALILWSMSWKANGESLFQVSWQNSDHLSIKLSSPQNLIFFGVYCFKKLTHKSCFLKGIYQSRYLCFQQHLHISLWLIHLICYSFNYWLSVTEINNTPSVPKYKT